MGPKKEKVLVRIRKTSDRVKQSPGCKPFHDMYSKAVALKPTGWNQVESMFLAAMGAFDANVASGVADQGDWQNCKGDFFNDLLALILENCSKIDLLTRHEIPGLIIPNHNLDITYPATGVAQFLLEAKAVGQPKHPGSQKQKAMGRRGSADLDKRVREASFKTIDLKLEYGRQRAEAGEAPETVPGGSLKSWLKSNKPTTYLFISARVLGDTDLKAVLRQADVAAQVMDGVGVFAFEPVSTEKPTEYQAVKKKKSLIPNHFAIGNVLYEACQELAGIKKKGVEPKKAPPGPAQEAAELTDEASGSESAGVETD